MGSIFPTQEQSHNHEYANEANVATSTVNHSNTPLDSISTTSSDSSASSEEDTHHRRCASNVASDNPDSTTAVAGNVLETSEIDEMSRSLLYTDFLPVGRRLGLADQKLQDIEQDCHLRGSGTREMVYQMFTAWKQKKGNDAHKQKVIDALLHVQRKDIVDKLFSGSKPTLITRFINGMGFQVPTSSTTSEAIQQKQREFYQRLIIPPVGWLSRTLHLGEIYITQTYFIKSKKNLKPDPSSNLADIFKGSPKRILITGPSKCGKTTLLAKFMYDWAMYEPYMTKRFDFVFIIPQRHFKKDVTQTILSQCNVPVGDDQKRRAVFANDEKILLIFDGLEEMSSEMSKSVKKFLKDPKYASMTILMTCREEKFLYGDRISKVSNTAVGPTLYDDWDKVSWQQKVMLGNVPIKKLPVRYLGQEEHATDTSPNKTDSSHETSSSDEAEEVQKKPECPNDIIQAPLMCVFFTLFSKWINMKHTIPNKLELYKQMCNFLVERTLTSQSMHSTTNDIFNPNRKFWHSLVQLGKISYDKLKLHSLVFEEQEISQHFSKKHQPIAFAFFTQPVVFFNQCDTYYEPLHERFIELFAALYLSTLKERELRFELDQLLGGEIPSTQTGYMFAFLVSFLGEKAYHLLQVLQVVSPFTIGEDGQFDDILAGVQSTDQNLQSIMLYMHPIWDNEYLELYPRSQCLHYGIRHGYLQKVQLRAKSFWKYINVLPTDKEIPELMIDAGRFFHPEDLPTKTELKMIPCQTLRVKFNKHNTEENWTNLKKLLSTIQYKQLILQLSDYDLDSQQDFNRLKTEFKLLKKFLPEMQLYQLMLLGVGVQELLGLIPILENMLVDGKIENGLRINLGGTLGDIERDLIQPFIDKIAASGIKKFFFEYNSTENNLNFGHLSEDFSEWEYIYHTESVDYESEPQTFKGKINHLDCQGFKESTAKEKLSFLTEIRRITCFDGFLQAVNELPHNWNGFKTITQLDILRFKEDLRIEQFQSLSQLNLEFSFIFDRNKEDKILANLIEKIKSLPSLKVIALQRTNSNNVTFAIKFLNKLASDEHSVHLEEIVIEFNGAVTLDQTLLHAIRNCLANQKVTLFSLMFFNLSSMREVQDIWDYNRTNATSFKIFYKPYLSDPFTWQDIHQIVFQRKRFYICLQSIAAIPHH